MNFIFYHHLATILPEPDQARPELIERSIQQGDIFTAACGEKESRGHVRALGPGPTPQDVGTLGLKCYKSTRLQMEVLAHEEVESDKASLERCIKELEEELQEARIVQERGNVEITSHNGSNSRNHVSSRTEEHVDEAHHAQLFEDDIFADINENSDHYDEDDKLLVPRPPAAPSVQHANSLSVQRANFLSTRAAALSAQRAPAPSVQPAQRVPAPSMQPTPALSARAAARSAQPAAATLSTQLAPAASTQRAPASSVCSVVGGLIDLHRESSATSPIKNVAPSNKNKAPHVSPDEIVGKEVILYALLHPEAVAKAVVISTNPSNVLGGQPLGRLFYEVVVKVVIKRDTVIPHPYGDIETLADAESMPIQWPYNRLKLSKASHSSKSSAGHPTRS